MTLFSEQKKSFFDFPRLKLFQYLVFSICSCLNRAACEVKKKELQPEACQSNVLHTHSPLCTLSSRKRATFLKHQASPSISQIMTSRITGEHLAAVSEASAPSKDATVVVVENLAGDNYGQIP